ncbi:hypothetical protein Patl1_25409 [Pistacia atlantica]|uniref:Uncharacterized protein n=1 Tax=Pistacia atlantica TaxID=434234 RepID=A0ACC1AZX2_9ROSI|nr:hypothetical protein Patl1_25409 [Pistacia atlantica]
MYLTEFLLSFRFLQNNNLTGQIPSSLLRKAGLNLKTSPGNQLSSPPPS